MESELISQELMESMGLSQMAYEEVQSIIGRMPTIDELSTLLAMWKSNGSQQSLLGWLKGQYHLVERHEYFYEGDGDLYKNIKEPRIKECIEISHQLSKSVFLDDFPQFQSSSEVFLVGNVNTDFLHSEYAAKCLHIVEEPISMGSHEEDLAYHHMILDVLAENGVVRTVAEVGQGGLFVALVASGRQVKVGFDILTCKEVRLDSFLFGEERGRIITTIPDDQEDFFLQKMDEARINCCFLGRTTKGRILVDGMDFGDITEYAKGRSIAQ